MIRRRIALIYWVIALSLFVPGAAHAYIDPATTTYLIQIATALVVTLGVSLSVFLYRFRMVSSKIKYWLYALLYRKKLKDAGDADGAAGNIAQKDACILPAFVLPGTEAPPELSSFAPDVREALETGKAAAFPVKTVAGNELEKKYTGRLRLTLPAAVALCFSFIVVGCLELVVQYAPELPFELSQIVPVILLCAAALFVLLVLIIPLFKGNLFEIIVSLGLAALIAGYVQGNFLNAGIGALTGDAVIWSQLRSQMASSLICWILCFVLILILWRRAKDAWHKVLLFVPLLLILIQGVGFVSVINDHSNDGMWGAGVYWKNANETLTVDRIGELAKGKNAIILLLDRLDQDFIEEIAAEDPNFFAPLDGFTEFDDYISYAGSTFPSVCGFLTGHRYMYDEPRLQYFNDAWSHADFLDDLKTRGADIRLYLDRGFAFSNTSQLHGLADNIFQGEAVGINKRIALVKLLKLAGYRYAPLPMKQFFWLAPTEFIDTLELTEKTSPYVVDDFGFYRRLTEEGLRISDDEKSFIYYHLLGPHPPLNMDENIQYVEDADIVDQARGSLKIVYEFLRQMKELGVYDDSLIIIMGDHGNYLGDDLEAPARTGLLVKPAGSAGTPLQFSHAPVCPDQLHATLMTGLYGDSEGFGDTFFDIREGDAMTRTYSINHARYQINGDGRDFANWQALEPFPDTYE